VRALAVEGVGGPASTHPRPVDVAVTVGAPVPLGRSQADILFSN
jgi:hypothetical protein